MALMTSEHWNMQSGVCTKHNLPQIPCPKCIANCDEDIEFVLSNEDEMAMTFDKIKSVDDLLPEGFSVKTHSVRWAIVY